MKIALCFNGDREDTVGVYFQRALRAWPQHEVVRVATRDAWQLQGQCDFYLRIDHGDYADDLPDTLHPAAFYAIDTHLKHPYRKIRRQSSHYDIMFCAQRDGARRLSRQTRREVHWVPLGCDPDIHRRQDVAKTLDIGFVGTDGKKGRRKRLLALLAQRYPSHCIGQARYQDMSAIYSRSKIGFNCSIRNDVNMRVFEVLSCGSLLLTNRIKDSGLEELFADGVHVVQYGSTRHLLRLIETYLGNDEARERIARQGCALAVSKHRYVDRMASMLRHAGRQLGWCEADMAPTPDVHRADHVTEHA